MDARDLFKQIQHEAGQAHGLSRVGPPIYVINGIVMPGPFDGAAFERTVQAQVAKANAMLKAGKAQEELYDSLVAANHRGAGGQAH
jgi:hypothetical protein